MNSDLSPEGIRQAVATSPEGQRVAAIRASYLAQFARDPLTGDCPGLRTWAVSDRPLREIDALLAASPEGQRVLAVRDLYLELLGRDPLGADNTGLRYWVEWPVPLAQVREAILASEEYRRRAGAG